MKTEKCFAGIILVFLLGVCLCACLKPVPVDAVMTGEEKICLD